MATLTTPLCRLLGIDLPIIAAPITSSAEFVAAVSNAGGLGIIQATWLNTNYLRRTIADVRSRTDRPFGANFILSLTAGNGHANLDATLDEGVGVISTFWGDPAPVIGRIHDAGALSLHTVGSAAEARRVVDLGVDCVVAQGVEAGGHVWGDVGSMVLTPAVADAVPGTPVIAAGGIADGRGLAAALALGAEAVWVGTRLLLSSECKIHPTYREKLIRARETDTLLANLFDGGWPDAPSRCLANETTDAWIASGRPAPGSRPNEGEIIAFDGSGTPIPRYDSQEPKDGMTGTVAAMAMYAGQGVGLATTLQPVADILADMVADASMILSRLSGT